MIKSLKQIMLILLLQEHKLIKKLQNVGMEIMLSRTCIDGFPFHTIAGLITEVARKRESLSSKVLGT